MMLMLKIKMVYVKYIVCFCNLIEYFQYRALSVAVKLKDLTCLKLLLNHPKINVNAVANSQGVSTKIELYFHYTSIILDYVVNSFAYSYF